MPTFEQIANIEQIKEEYKKTFLLNIFQKLCIKMNNNYLIKNRMLTLFRQSNDQLETTKIIISKTFNYDLNDEDAALVKSWLHAYFKKSNIRKNIPTSIKHKLYEEQNGKCIICEENLGTDWSKIHVDHIIPWILVGDELPNNYQLLCDTCNQCKSSRIDYIFKSLLHLT